MRILSRMLKLGRPRLRSLVIVALLTSGAAAAGLLEPWLYRAIINDVAGVFVAEDDDVEEGLQLVLRATQHLTDSASRIFAAPLRPFIPPPSGDARELETEVEHGAQRPSLSPDPGAVMFRKVRFGYAGDAVLKDVSFEIPAGQRVALVGPSGAGKTTVTDLLCALYQADGGDIQVDGQSLREVSPESVRQAIRGVGVDSAVFAGTIRNNIVYGRPDATESELEAALAACGLGSHGGRWRQGLDTEVEDRGVNLSAGERQRLLLARAIVSKPRVLILDEATANLDFSSEEAVRAAVRALGPQITTIIIAHRPAMVADVDRVLVLREGRIEEDGSPDDLVRRGGYFSQMMAKAAA